MAITEWHYTIDGQPAAAPVSPAQLKQLAASGKLKPTDLVWQDGMLEWAQAGSVKGLFPPGASLGDSAVVPPAAATKIAEGRKTTKVRPPRDWGKMHPFLVFVLTLGSAGIFGLIYCSKICRAYSAKAASRKIDGAGRALGKVRHPFGVLLLSYLTFGFYFYYWLYRVLGECNEYLGRKDDPPRSELSLMLIFPPYAVYLAVFVLPELVRKAQALAGAPETAELRQTVLFLNPILIFGVPLLGMICQETLNKLWLTA